MKVLKKGRKQKGWTKKFKCTGDGNEGGGCGALLLVEAGDLFQTERNCYDETDYFTTFKCPECGVLTDIQENISFKIPSKYEWEKQRSDPYNRG